ncbi:hypothetical protein [Glycomyces sp. MUSA5-2]|uniref:pPIWI_RE_Z domain-containing protein n=1 Tax=Glycomyces sp. MUSA5-2 TaxID=2053002 RepID=UPI00300924D4
MRSTADWSESIEAGLRGWPAELKGTITPAAMARVELGLHLLLDVLPEGRARDGWTLLGGMPYAEVFHADLTDEQRHRIACARQYLGSLRRRHIWRRQVKRYMQVPEQFRGFALTDLDSRPEQRQELALAAGRFALYDQVLDSLPDLVQAPLPIARAGEHRFRVGDRHFSVNLPESLAASPAPRQYSFGQPKAGGGNPIIITGSELLAAAKAMDAAEAVLPQGQRRQWVQSLGDVRVATAFGGFVFDEDWQFTIADLFHLVGMVGAGKSTISFLLTYHCVVHLGLKVTIVVGDVAESLRATAIFNRLGHPQVHAAPIIGRTTRERHIHRLHRRQHGSGAASMLEHNDPAFDYLSSACMIDALRGLEGVTPLRLHEAPCTSLLPVAAPVLDDPFTDEDAEALPTTARRPEPERFHGCPAWSICPRHQGARELIDAPIWIATVPGLLHASVPRHQTDARIRYLEAACDRSDLIIVDEADRVQTQLDIHFAPAATLCGRGADSWIDWLRRHTLEQINAQGRRQLSDKEVSRWIVALNAVAAAADRIYSMLNDDQDLRRWVGTDYFSAATLHRELYRDWFGGVITSEEDDAGESLFERVLNDFRDKPLQTSVPRTHPHAALLRELVDMANAIVINTDVDHARLGRLIAGLTCEASEPAGSDDADRQRFAFTLLVAVLDDQLTVLTSMWPLVESALNLESASNALTRTPPRDYEPLMAESPMGNVLGYQFTPEQPGPPPHSGSLRFFHCSGLGRDLLQRLPSLGASADRPGPHVLAMSATSWAGTSSRYHLHAPVDAILSPRQDYVDRVRETVFHSQFLEDSDGRPLRLSGNRTPEQRRAVLTEMLRQLAEPDRKLVGQTSPFQDELAEIKDPRRRRLLLLTGSYEEARVAAHFLNDLPEWKGKVTLLIADDADNDDSWFSLRRGDLAAYPRLDSQILVAPLLAVERGHNIVLDDGTAAIGTVYFLARPHDRPDDINLAIHAENDWAMRFVGDGEFDALRYGNPTPDQAAAAFRRQAVRKWHRYLTRTVAWSSLKDGEKDSFTWDQLVVMWQVIGRLVRGGAPARVKFCDAAFAPGLASGNTARDTPDTSMLKRFEAILEPHLAPDGNASAYNRAIAQALFQPFWDALISLDTKE